MAISLDSKQIVSFEEFFMSQVVSQEARVTLHLCREILTKEESLEMVKVDQMNMSTHHVREGFWVDLHISKVLYQPKDRLTFIEFIKSIKFKPNK